MEWIRIFDNEEIARRVVQPDKPQLVIIGTKRIALVRHDDSFFAVQDACTHNGESLSKGRINFLGEVICPWHGYRFDLRSGQARDSSCRDLEVYQTKADQSGFYIGLP